MAQQTVYHKVTFLPENKTIEVPDRITIFETILENNPRNIQLRFACGAEGICQKCKIRAFQKMGPLTPTEKGCLTEEELQKGIRLACQARVIQDTQVEILYKMPFSIQLTDEPIDGIALNPRIYKIYCAPVSGHCLSGQCVLDRLRDVGIAEFDPQAAERALKDKFTGVFSQEPCGCTAVVIGRELAAIEPGDTTAHQYAVAVDLGVNTIAASLVDLRRGRKIASVIDTNPQLEFGENYAQRVSLIEDNPLNLEILSEEMLLRIDILILELCRARNVLPEHVYEIAVSGGTGMLHLFLKGVAGPLEQHAAAANAAGFSARQFDFKSAQQARVHALPVIAAYAGADITAGILATRLHRSPETALLLDLGTDLKAVLHHRGRIVAASLPGYGVFDGVGIVCGMRPETGAIQNVRIDTSVHLGVIGESLPRGICGSGLVELAAALKNAGIINAHGDYTDVQPRIAAAGCGAPAFCGIDGSPAFRLYSDAGEFATDIYVTHADLRQLRQAKASVVVLMRRLAAEAGVGWEEISRVLISGTFGTAVSIEAFFTLGVLPGCFSGRVLFAGNTSKLGAQMVLLDRALLDEAETIVRRAECLGLSADSFSDDDLLFEPLM